MQIPSWDFALVIYLISVALLLDCLGQEILKTGLRQFVAVTVISLSSAAVAFFGIWLFSLILIGDAASLGQFLSPLWATEWLLIALIIQRFIHPHVARL